MRANSRTSMPLVVASLLVGCAAKLSSQAADVEHSLTIEEQIIYAYELVHSSDSSVCTHMQRVFNQSFRQPWNFRSYFRETYPKVFENWYLGSMKSREDEARFPFYMRYALAPVSPEYSAIKWEEKLLIGSSGQHLPARLTQVDLDNNGTTDTLVQTLFYGWGDGRDSRDSFVLWRDKAPDSVEQLALTQEELFYRSAGMERFSGSILRPFRLGGVTYFSLYVENVNGIYDANVLGRHLPPEKMLVMRYVGGQLSAQVQQVNGNAICEFQMRRVVDPLKRKTS